MIKLKLKSSREENFWSEYLARFEARSQRLEPDANTASIRGREPEAGARRVHGQHSGPRARGWSQTRTRPGFGAESQRLEPDAYMARIRGPEPEAGARRV